MNRSRVAAIILSLLLLSLLIWSLLNRIRDQRLLIMLGFGVCLGAIYAVNGRLPQWMISASSKSLTADDDPANISPRLYLPILAGVVIVALLVLSVGLLSI
ncbi:MAG TPA: hypothetical protein VGM98_17230 [Schlesneria sp.]